MGSGHAAGSQDEDNGSTQDHDMDSYNGTYNKWKVNGGIINIG